MTKNNLLIFGGIALIIYMATKKASATTSATSPAITPASGGSTTIPKGKYFQLNEFHSGDGEKVPTKYYTNLQELINNLDIIRESIGKPMRINSGYRSVKHNAKVGGKKNSYHLRAMAADIRVIGMTPVQFRAELEKLIASGKIKQGGVGSYPTFTHYDIRGTKSRWSS